MQQGIAKGDVLSRIAGIAFIVGGVLLIVGNILHPRVSDPSNMQALIQSIAGNTGGLWELDHLLLAAGIWGLMIGVVGGLPLHLHRSRRCLGPSGLLRRDCGHHTMVGPVRPGGAGAGRRGGRVGQGLWGRKGHLIPGGVLLKSCYYGHV